MLLVNQDTGDAWVLRWKGAQIAARSRVDDFDPICARVSDVDPPTAPEDIGVVKA